MEGVTRCSETDGLCLNQFASTQEPPGCLVWRKFLTFSLVQVPHLERANATSGVKSRSEWCASMRMCHMCKLLDRGWRWALGDDGSRSLPGS